MKAKGNTVGFKKGFDPNRNPGGRPKLAKAWQAALGKSTAEVTAEALKLVWDVFVQGPGTSGKEGDPNDPNWRFAAQKVLEYSAGKPRDEVEVTIQDGEDREIDWTKIPLEQRERLLSAMRELELLTASGEETEH